MAANGKIDPYVWRISMVVILGSIMSILDTTIVNVALETLGRDLHSTVSEIQWVVTGYMLSLAAGDPRHRLGRPQVRREARLRPVPHSLHGRLGALRAGHLHRAACRLPGAPG